jgi:hypothetical protein
MAEEWIERAVRSVLDERAIHLECIVVDDASPDGTGAVLARLAPADPRLIVLTRPSNAGVSEARNVALEAARGTWLTFLDADDRLTPGALRALVRPTVDEDVLAVVAQRVWTDGTRVWRSRAYDQAAVTAPGRRALADSPGLVNYLSVTGKLFHRSLARDLRFHGRVLGDQPWCLVALLRAGGGIEVVSDVVYEWDRPPAGSDRQTITTRKRSSVASAVETVEMATEAVGIAITATNELVEDPVRRQAVVRAYCERLIGSDVGRLIGVGPAGAAHEHAPLYEAVGTFLEAVPAEVVARSGRAVDALVAPPLLRYHRLGGEGRAAHRRIVSIVLSARLAPASGATRQAVVLVAFGAGIARALMRQIAGRAVRGIRRTMGIARR